MVAITHIRGGGELGGSWYEQALGSNNKTTGIKDLVAAAEYLQKKGYTDR